jgi:rhodanese-related sulfurtransferase
VAIPRQRRSLGELLEAAQASITRWKPADAALAIDQGATLIDIRCDLDRERDGLVPGSLHIPRTVLEWRLAPDSGWRTPYAPDLDAHVIVMCDHGCSSVLAAATLVDLGFARAGDVIGGYAAWRTAGLVTTPAPRDARGPAGLPGTRAPQGERVAADALRWPSSSSTEPAIRPPAT